MYLPKSLKKVLVNYADMVISPFYVPKNSEPFFKITELFYLKHHAVFENQHAVFPKTIRCFFKNNTLFC
jgi:hypothetical protein